MGGRSGRMFRRYPQRCDAFQVLGPLQITENGVEIILGGHRQRSVLVLLIVEAGRRSQSIALFPRSGPMIRRDSPWLSLHLRIAAAEGAWAGSHRPARTAAIDWTFPNPTASTQSSSKAPWRRLVDCLAPIRQLPVNSSASALDLWRGRPFEGFEDLASLVSEAVRLEELHLNAEEDRFEAELRVVAHRPPAALNACANDTPTGNGWGLLARTLYRAGRQAEALRVSPGAVAPR